VSGSEVRHQLLVGVASGLRRRSGPARPRKMARCRGQNRSRRSRRSESSASAETAVRSTVRARLFGGVRVVTSRGVDVGTSMEMGAVTDPEAERDAGVASSRRR
jgi:hypothetical protein